MWRERSVTADRVWVKYGRVRDKDNIDCLPVSLFLKPERKFKSNWVLARQKYFSGFFGGFFLGFLGFFFGFFFGFFLGFL